MALDRVATMADGIANRSTWDLTFTHVQAYVDDLVTDAAARSHGHGEVMLAWLIASAKKAGCVAFSLDSGTHRQDAHAFYLRHRLRITAFHFYLPL